MSKRKLTRRQAWRIEKVQEEKAQRAQKKEQNIHEQLNAGELGPEIHGRVMAHFGSQVEIESVDEQGPRYRCFLRANLGSLITGDLVVFRIGANFTGVVEKVLERRSVLSRPNMYNEVKPVAANIDAIVLVIAPEPLAHTNLIDRYLVAAENNQITPIILLNKTDLLNSENSEYLLAILQDYSALGYQTMQVCSRDESSLGELKAFLNQQTSVFVGQSGVGKSSLISTLLPDEELKIGALSENTRKGKHTTTTARLYHFPAGGDLIDSPGIREFGLWHMDEEEVMYGFKELRALHGHCRFRNCAHLQEPGCALLQAVEQGQVKQQRLDSYHRIVQSLAEL
ncbi:MAG: small ribosomal subunit biogenesis GTPase RsgA [Venatoribacter sp.]